MAEEKKTTTTRGRKSKEEIVVNNNDELEKVKKENAELSAMLKQMQETIAGLSSQINNPIVVQSQNNDLTRNVKVISMLDNSYTLYTLPNCQGNKVVFEKYGDSRMIRFVDLQSILQIYIRQFEKGFAVLTNKKDYDDLGIGYIYDDVIGKDKMDSIINLEDDACIDIILDMDDDMLDNVLRMISSKLSNGFPYDINRIRVLESETDLLKYEENANQDKEIFDAQKK